MVRVKASLLVVVLKMKKKKIGCLYSSPSSGGLLNIFAEV